jgi:hypothetical protein
MRAKEACGLVVVRACMHLVQQVASICTSQRRGCRLISQLAAAREALCVLCEERLRAWRLRWLRTFSLLRICPLAARTPHARMRTD